MKKLTMAMVACLIAVSVLPVVSNAATNADLQAQIQALLAQIQQLQAQLTAQGGTGTSWCHTFNTNLGVGSSGDEVTALQTALTKEGVGAEKNWTSGTFDEVTASAVTGFQEKYRSDILTPAGLVNGTGYVGARTRAKLNALYGCGVVTPPPVVCPTVAKLCPDGTYVSPVPPTCQFPACPVSTTTSTPPYPSQQLTMISPAGGERWQIGSQQTISWTDSGLRDGDTYTLFLTNANGGAYGIIGNAIVHPIYGNPNSGWVVGRLTNNATVPPGDYYIQVVKQYQSAGGVYIQSKAFTIVAATATQHGSLNVSADPIQPSSGQVVMGSTGVALAAFRLTETSNVESLKVTDLTVTDYTASNNTAAFSNLTLSSGGTVLGTAGAPTRLANGSYAYQFHFPTPVVIPQSNSVSFVLRGDVVPWIALNPNDNGVHQFEIINSSDVTALGTASNIAANVNISNANGNGVAVLRSTLSLVVSPSGATSNRTPVSADALGTIMLTANPAGPVALGRLTITFQGSGLSSNANGFLQSVQLIDQNGGNIGVPVGFSVNGTAATWDLSNYQIPAGVQYYFQLRANSTLLQGSAPITLSAAIKSPVDLTYADALDPYATRGLTIPAGFPFVINSVSYLGGTPQAMGVSPASLSFTASSNAINNPSPASSQLMLTNYPNTGVTVTKTYTSPLPSGADWLSIGALTGSGTTKTITVTPQPWNAPAGLSPGTYTASIAISANGQTITVPVTLTVTSSPVQPVLSVSPASLSFTVQQGATSVPSQSLSVSLSSGASDIKTSVSYGSGNGWLTASATTGVSAGVPGNVVVTVNPTGLSAGNYAATISVSAFGVAISVPVTLTVSAQPKPSVTLNGVQGYNPTTGAYTNNTALASTYLVLYGTFGSSLLNAVAIDGGAPSMSAVTYQSATQINVSLAGIATGSHTVAVSTPYGMTNSLPFTVTNAVTAPSPVLNGVQGYNPTTGAYTNNTALASTYLVLYGTFGSSGNGVLIDGSAVSASAVTYQSATQINVSLTGIATGSHTVAVLTTTGTTGSLPFTVTASGGGASYLPGTPQAQNLNQMADVLQSMKGILQSLSQMLQ